MRHYIDGRRRGSYLISLARGKVIPQLIIRDREESCIVFTCIIIRSRLFVICHPIVWDDRHSTICYLYHRWYGRLVGVISLGPFYSILQWLDSYDRCDYTIGVWVCVLLGWLELLPRSMDYPKFFIFLSLLLPIWLHNLSFILESSGPNSPRYALCFSSSSRILDLVLPWLLFHYLHNMLALLSYWLYLLYLWNSVGLCLISTICLVQILHFCPLQIIIWVPTRCWLPFVS